MVVAAASSIQMQERPEDKKEISPQACNIESSLHSVSDISVASRLLQKESLKKKKHGKYLSRSACLHPTHTVTSWWVLSVPEKSSVKSLYLSE